MDINEMFSSLLANSQKDFDSAMEKLRQDNLAAIAIYQLRTDAEQKQRRADVVDKARKEIGDELAEKLRKKLEEK